MRPDIAITLESMVVIVGGAVMLGFTVDGSDWRFFIIDAEEID